MESEYKKIAKNLWNEIITGGWNMLAGGYIETMQDMLRADQREKMEKIVRECEIEPERKTVEYSQIRKFLPYEIVD